MCRMCNENSGCEFAQVKGAGKYGRAYLDTISKTVEVTDSDYRKYSFRVKYCPWCGRKL